MHKRWVLFYYDQTNVDLNYKIFSHHLCKNGVSQPPGSKDGEGYVHLTSVGVARACFSAQNVIFDATNMLFLRTWTFDVAQCWIYVFFVKSGGAALELALLRCRRCLYEWISQDESFLYRVRGQTWCPDSSQKRYLSTDLMAPGKRPQRLFASIQCFLQKRGRGIRTTKLGPRS